MKSRFTSYLTCQAGLLFGLLSLLIAPSFAAPTLNGLAAHSLQGKEQFIAALYVDSPTDVAVALLQAQEHKRMELRVTARRISARHLQNMWIDGMATNVRGDLLSKHASNMVSFTGLIKGKLAAGDNLTIDAAPAQPVRVAVNGIELGSIADSEFFTLLLQTWIGGVPLSNQFRDQLLQAGKVDPEVQQRFADLAPRDSRVAAVRAWMPVGTPVKQAAAKPRKLAPAPKSGTKLASSPPKPIVAAHTPKTRKVAAAPNTTTRVPEPSTAAAPRAAANTEPKARRPYPKPIAANLPMAVTATRAPLDDELEMLDEDEQGPALTAETLLSRQIYHSKLLKWTYKYLTYPRRAEKRSQEGSVRLSVTIDRKGRVKAINATELSDFDALNREARSAVKRASPFPSMPDNVTGKEFAFSLPIVFRLPD